MKTVITVVITAAVVLVLITAGFIYFTRSKPPASPPATQTPLPTASKPTQSATPTSQPPPTQTPSTLEQNITSLEQAINNIATTGQSQEVTLTITESEANVQAAAMLTSATMPPDVPLEIKGVKIDFKPGNIILAEIDTVLHAVISLSVKVNVQMQVGIQAGKPTASVTDVSFTGSSLLPPSAKDQITSLITQQIDQLITQLTTAELAGGKVVLEYTKINIQETSAAVTVLVKPK